MKYIVHALLIVSTFLLFIGCSTPKKELPPPSPSPIKKEIKTFTPIARYLTEDVGPFVHGEYVTLIDANATHGFTKRGTIPLDKLEAQRSTFQLNIKSTPKAEIKILNIKPKYHKNIWLKPGRYQVEVSAKGYVKERRWVTLDKGTTLTFVLKKSAPKKEPLIGKVTWSTTPTIIDNSNIYVAPTPNKKHAWSEANRVCQNYSTTLFKHTVTTWRLPTTQELLQLHSEENTTQKGLYWSATTDERQLNYAKYVNLHTKESSWYKKLGKAYVLCQYNSGVALTESVQDIVKSLASEMGKERRKERLSLYTFALYLKYGNPQAEDLVYDQEKGLLSYRLVSQNRDNGKPLFQKLIKQRSSLAQAKILQAKQKQKQKRLTITAIFKVTSKGLYFLNATLEVP